MLKKTNLTMAQPFNFHPNISSSATNQNGVVKRIMPLAWQEDDFSSAPTSTPILTSLG
jgi:hypothetical protein